MADYSQVAKYVRNFIPGANPLTSQNITLQKLYMENQLPITNNEKQLQFEYREGDELAYLEYRYYKNDIAFMHTLVPESMGGKGIASALARFAFDYAKKQNKQVIVYCPFVAKFLQSHPEFKSQLDPQYRG